jgi:hypothetical protein
MSKDPSLFYSGMWRSRTDVNAATQGHTTLHLRSISAETSCYVIISLIKQRPYVIPIHATDKGLFITPVLSCDIISNRDMNIRTNELRRDRKYISAQTFMVRLAQYL